MLKFGGAVIWRLGKRVTVRKYSGPSATVFKTDKSEVTASTVSTPPTAHPDKDSGLLAAAFAALNDPEGEIHKQPSFKSAKISKMLELDKQISSADNIDDLLKVAENSIVSRRHALKIVSVLSDWSSNKKVKILEFEKDPRFLKVCRILARTPASQALSSMRTTTDDLSTILGITGDDEAARLISNLTLSQMVKVLQALQTKGRRSTPLLRALAFNIVRRPETIDLKKSADILYSVSALNFPDPVLLDRICNDVITSLPENPDKPAAVVSIVRSLGQLRYRHAACIEAAAGWLARATSDPVHIHTVTVTLALLDCHDQQIIEMAQTLKEEDLPKSQMWLDLVFSLLVLDKANQEQLVSTIKPEFIEKLLASGEIPIPARRKLLSIDGYLSLTNYTGPRLPEEISSDVPLVYTKDKIAFVQSVMDTFRNLVSSDRFMKKECNPGMGFLYDAEFALDSKCHPVPLEKAANNKDVYRIAALCLEYHDMCARSALPLGNFKLYARLLAMQGFHVLQIPYTEFNPKDKLVTRVKYIEEKLKQIVASRH